MPWNPKRYPAHWASEIRPALLARAEHRCEGIPRHPDCRALNHTLHPETGSMVVLTCAHTCACEPPCGELTHLKALCQRCHLTLDAPLHARHAAETRRLAKEAQGQRTFLSGKGDGCHGTMS